MITIEEARLRGITLPDDDSAAQDVVDEAEAWLAARIGPLDGERTETFWVGLGVSNGKLSLARYTDEVAVVDGGSAVDPDLVRLIDNGSAFRFGYPNGYRVWTGPYVEATYTPNDELLVRAALFGLVAIETSSSVGPFQSESMGAYSYSRGEGTSSPFATRGALVASILPRRPQMTTLRLGRLSEVRA